MKISEINWGDDSAEKDPNLLNYFVTPTTIKRLDSQNKSLIVGRKGSGKSALLKKLNDTYSQNKSIIPISIKPSFNAIKNILSDQALVNNFGEEVFFQYAWMRLLFYKAVVAFGDSSQGKYVKNSFEFARNLAKKDQLTSPDILEVVADLFTKIQVKAGKLGDLGINIEKDLKVLSDVPQYMFHTNNIIEKTDVKIIFLIDDLDHLWDNSRTSNNLLLGLLSCCNTMQAFSSNIHLFIAMREDVYKILLRDTQHSDKYRNIENIRWDRENLKQILDERIIYNFKENGAYLNGEPFKNVFPDQVGGIETIEWMIQRTLERPRELLQLARIYSEKNDSITPSKKILRRVEHTYSDWKLDDLCNEYMYQYPGLRTFFSYWKKSLEEIIFFFTRNQFDDIFLKIMACCEPNETWLYKIKNEVDSSGLLSILFEIGFIGDVVHSNGTKHIIYSMNSPHKPSFQNCAIHPCFIKSMTLTGPPIEFTEC